MKSKFLPHIDRNLVKKAGEAEDYDLLYVLLAEPLHEELYKRQTFDFIDDLSVGQQLLLAYDYVRTQVGQGGFIQLIQNGYVPLLPDMPGWLNDVGAHNMAQVIDDALKVYVLNRELLDQKTTVEEFALLYQELKEFELIDKRYEEANKDTIKKILHYATTHLEEFISEDSA